MHVIIVGGGLSGCALAATLLAKKSRVEHITLVERAEQPGLGLAYSTPYASHLLNVKAENMGLFADAPGDFLQWLRRRHADFPYGSAPAANLFAQRRHFGLYVQDKLAAAAHAGFATFTHVRGEAVDLTDSGEVTLASGDILRGDAAVLCVGHAPPALPRGLVAIGREPCVHINPWQWSHIESIPRDAEVLIVGTGLTMLDVALALRERGFVGRITALSRHGLLPRAHVTEPSSGAGALFEAGLPTSARHLVRTVRAATEKHAWRAVVDGLRPQTPALWRALPPAEQRRFLRHVRAYWEVHRHRIAPQVDAAMVQLQTEGQLRVLAGQVMESAVAPDFGVGVKMCLRHDGSETWQRFNVVVNCTGALPRLAQMDSPLLTRMHARGAVMPGEQNLGFAVDAHGALIDNVGRVSQRIFAIGTAWTGRDYESVAVPELRVQAACVATALAQSSCNERC